MKLLPLTYGETVIRTSPSEVWRFLLKCEGDKLDGVVITKLEWIHLEPSEVMVHRVLGGGAYNYSARSQGYLIYPIVAHCGMVQQ